MFGGGSENLCVFASGYSYATQGVSPLKLTLAAATSADRRGQGGARLILEEG